MSVNKQLVGGAKDLLRAYFEAESAHDDLVMDISAIEAEMYDLRNKIASMFKTHQLDINDVLDLDNDNGEDSDPYLEVAASEVHCNCCCSSEEYLDSTSGMCLDCTEDWPMGTQLNCHKCNECAYLNEAGYCKGCAPKEDSNDF